MSTEHAPVLWAKVPAGYLDADHLGLLLPAPADGPQRYRLTAAHLAAVVASCRAAWAHIDEVRIRFVNAPPTDRRLAALVGAGDRHDRRPHMTRRSTTRHRVTPPLARRYWRHHGHRRGR